MNRTHFHAFESVWRHVSSPLRQLFIRVTAQSQQPLYQKLGAVWTNWGIIIALDCKSLHPTNKLIWLIIQRGEVKPAFTHWYQENKHQCTKSLTLELLADLKATASDWSATSVEIQMWGKKWFSEEKVGYCLVWADVFPEILQRMYLGSNYSQKRNVTLVENILRGRRVYNS